MSYLCVLDDELVGDLVNNALVSRLGRLRHGRRASGPEHKGDNGCMDGATMHRECK